MGARYSCGIRTTALLNQNGQSAAQLWNPHGTKSIFLRELWILHASGTLGAGEWEVFRTTTRGSPAATNTPNADNASDRRTAPTSGALVDAQTTSPSFPTLAGPELTQLGQFGTNVGVGHGHVLAWTNEAVEIPAGTGVAVFLPAANTNNLSDLDVSFTWDE